MYVFGGLEGITHETNDFYCFDFLKELWTTVQFKISNPENLKHIADNKESLAPNSHKDDRNKSLSKIPNMSLYGIDHKKNGKIKYPPLSRGRDKAIKDKFSKTFYNSPLRGLLTHIVIPKKVKDEEVEVNSPTTLALKSSIFLKSNDGFDHTSHAKKNTFHFNADIKKSARTPMMIPCPRDGASLTLSNNKLVIFGGDRYQMAFNDIFIFNP
mmetsp:Transcript_19692/g.17406  ORF Transcript_19692/g.17406 Transcript_19692/m.17406 type:complete len:212 (-) Transcript_19692:41-676(-)